MYDSPESRRWLLVNMDKDTTRSGTVLVAEHHLPTIHLLELAFEEIAPEVSVEFVETGTAAIERLASVEDGATRPDLVLLDLNLPLKSGHDVLRWRMASDEIGRIPVVVISDTSDPTAACLCYDLNAQAFISKPQGWEEFLDLTTVLVKHWFQYAESPVVSSPSDGPSSEFESTER